MLGRAEGDRERLQQALQSEGYWGGVAHITMAGLPLGDPGLPARLEATAARPVPVRITVEPGQPYRIASISIRATTPAEQPAVDAAAATPFGIAPGDIARAGPVLAAERTLLDRLLAAGHPLATKAGRETLVDHGAKTMEIAWRLAPGPAATFAPPEVEGAVQVRPEIPPPPGRAHHRRALQPGPAGTGAAGDDGARPLRFGPRPRRGTAGRRRPAAHHLHRQRAGPPCHRRHRRL